MSQQSNGPRRAPANEPGTPDPAADQPASLPEEPDLPNAGAQAGEEAALHDPAGAHLLGDEAPLDLHHQIEILHGQLAEVEKARLRAIADTENFRKRMERELAEARKYAVTAFATDIVPLLDTFQRAIASVPAQDTEFHPALKSLLDGVLMAERQFLNVLENHGIERTDPKNEIFDPHIHQAISQVPDPAVPAGTILQVAQPGFVIEGRVIRPAMVVVAQGGLKPMKPAQAPPLATTEEPDPAQIFAEEPVSEPGFEPDSTEYPEGAGGEPGSETGEEPGSDVSDNAGAQPEAKPRGSKISRDADAYEIAARRFKAAFGSASRAPGGGAATGGAGRPAKPAGTRPKRS